MSIELETYQRLRRKVEALQREYNKSEGQYDNVIEELKRDFGFDSIEEARKSIAKLDIKITSVKEEHVKLLKELDEIVGNKV